MKREQEYLLSLIAASVKNTMSPKPDNIDLEYLYFYSAQNQFDHIIYNHFKELGIHDESNPIMHSFHQRFGRAVVRDSTQDMSLLEICDTFSEMKIPHIPLKGSIVKVYYPLPDLRRSGDLDILIKAEDREKADAALLELGYTCDKYGNEVDDTYMRGDEMVELHRKLTDENDSAACFCKNVWQFASVENGYTYKMQNEFLYVYLLVHLRRHLLEMGGGGIKLVLDFWVLNKKLKLDEDILDNMLEEAHLTNLRRYVEALSRKWFGGEDNNDKSILILEDLILNSGAYGNYDTYLKMEFSKSNNGDNGNKVLNLIRLLCPPLKVMQGKYDWVKKHPYLLPISWIKRMMDAQKDHITSVVHTVGALSDDEAKVFSGFCKDINK